jgi:hypothetical protein
MEPFSSRVISPNDCGMDQVSGHVMEAKLGVSKNTEVIDNESKIETSPLRILNYFIALLVWEVLGWF